MTAIELLDAIEHVGRSLELNGGQIKYAIPKRATWLILELKENWEELIGLLREVKTRPPMPPVVRLLNWEQKEPPVAIVHMVIVNNVDKLIAATLGQLRARLEGKESLAGNWSLREIVDRLQQVGVVLQIGSSPSYQEKR